MKRLVAVAAFAAVLVLAAETALAWFAPVEGTPAAMQQGDKRGYFIWHDMNGMHVRVHTKMFAIPFSGTVKTDGQFVAVHGNKLEFGDHYSLDADKKTLKFKFLAAGGVDGIDFKVMGGTHLSFALFMGGSPVNPAEVYLGHEGWRPSSHQFMLRR